MCDVKDLDIESLRSEHESSTEWNLRRQFLEAHHDKFPMATLLCLSSCYLNVEMYGCRYPQQVMEKLRELAQSLGSNLHRYHSKIKARNEMKFIKAEDSPSTSGIGTKRKNENIYDKDGDISNTKNYKPNNAKPSISTAKKGGMSFVKSDESFSSINMSTQRSQSLVEKQLDPKFKNFINVVKKMLLSNLDKADGSLINEAASKSSVWLKVDFRMEKKGKKYLHTASVLIDGVFVAEQTSACKKSAKREAFKDALEVLCKSHHRIIEIKGEYKLEASDTPFVSINLNHIQDQSITEFSSNKVEVVEMKSKKYKERKWKIPNPLQVVCDKNSEPKTFKALDQDIRQLVVLYEPLEKNHGVNASSILQMSSNFSQVSFNYFFVKYQNGVQCKLTIGQNFEVQAQGETNKEAKLAAATKALHALRHTQYTVQFKKRVDNEGKSKKDVIGSLDDLDLGENAALPPTNIGNKLLRKLGWTGGGIGKDGQGIENPVQLDASIKREGLGLRSEAGVSEKFITRMRQYLLEYARSNEEGDLVFSSEFKKEEREVIHTEGSKLRLKTKSFNKKCEDGKTERYLVVSRKRTSAHLVQYLMEKGNETAQYKLIHPNEHEDINHDLD